VGLRRTTTATVEKQTAEKVKKKHVHVTQIKMKLSYIKLNNIR